MATHRSVERVVTITIVHRHDRGPPAKRWCCSTKLSTVPGHLGNSSTKPTRSPSPHAEAIASQRDRSQTSATRRLGSEEKNRRASSAYGRLPAAAVGGRADRNQSAVVPVPQCRKLDERYLLLAASNISTWPRFGGALSWSVFRLACVSGGDREGLLLYRGLCQAPVRLLPAVTLLRSG